MSRKNLNRRHLNFLARQRLARERRFQEATRALRRRTRKKAEARRLSARRSHNSEPSVSAKRSVAPTLSEAKPRSDLSPPPRFGQLQIPTPQSVRSSNAWISLPTKGQTDPSKLQNMALRRDISEKVRQFLMTLSLKRDTARKADYIAVWNQNLPGLGLTPDLLEAYRKTPPNKDALVEVIMACRDTEDGQSNRATPL